jgi:hypothetical protein
MAAVQPFPGSAFVKVEIDFTSNWNTSSPVYTDVTNDLRLSEGLMWDRGRNDEFQVVSPGSCQFGLDNRARTYDPTTNANIVPARPAQVTCYYPTTATAYQQIDLMAEDFDPVWTLSGDSIVKVNCIEAFGGLAFAKIASAAYVSTTAAGRLTDLANAAGWTGPTLWTAGQWLLTAGAPLYGPNVPVLSAMQDVAVGQAQVLYQTRSGVLSTHAAFTGTSASIATFGDNPANILAGTELPYVGIEDGVGGGYWYTDISLTYAQKYGPNGEHQTPSDTFTAKVGSNRSAQKYGSRTFAVTTAASALVNALAVAQSYAASLNLQPNYRIKQIQIRPMAKPAALFPIVLAADFGNVVTVLLTPPGGGGRITQTGKIRSIRHEITENDWLVTWMLSP